MKSIQVIMFIIIFSVIFACKKNIKNTPNNNQSNPSNIDNQNQELPEFEERYIKEGFIKKDTFRIVIVSDRRTTEDLESTKNQAEKRAFVILQKYLRSKNRLVDKNCQANLLDLINTDGNFSRKEFKNYENKVYYLEIKRKNLMNYLYSISDR